MTDFIYVPIWLLLSWLIRRADNKIDCGPGEDGGDSGTGSVDAGTELGTGSVAADAYKPIVQVIKIGIAAFTILLHGLSLSAYKKLP
jgi:hypothetical protein